MDRFPHPVFESGYELPTSSAPAPAAGWFDTLDVGVLVFAVLLASWLALRRRSRGGLLALTVFSLLYFGFWRRGCICPVGSIQNVAQALADPSCAAPVPVVLFFMIPLLATLLFGRTFCAAVCPLGAAQEVVILRPVKVPTWLAHGLSVIPYLYLGMAVLLAATGTGFLICRYDPFVTVFRLSGMPVMWLLAGAFLLAGTLVARPYCRFFCPYGALLGLVSKLSVRHTTIAPSECIQCRLCWDSCPFGAILKPTPREDSETRRKGVRRLAVVLCAVPILVAGGAWLGARLEVPISKWNPTIQLAEQIALQETGSAVGATNETDAFRGTGEPVSALYARARQVRRRIGLGGRLFGGFAGLVVAARLLALCLRRRRTISEPDKEFCFSCGRCFEYCPVGRNPDAIEKIRKKAGNRDDSTG